MSLRTVKVWRAQQWVTCRLKDVKAGDRVQINVEGTIVTGHAHTDGFEYTPGVGAVELTTDLYLETSGSTNGKQTS